MERLLILGAGATIEECIRSGNRPNDPAFCFPTVDNFCRKLFNRTSQVLLKVTASYLDKHGMDYDSLLLTQNAGDTFTGDGFRRSEPNQQSWRAFQYVGHDVAARHAPFGNGILQLAG